MVNKDSMLPLGNEELLHLPDLRCGALGHEVSAVLVRVPGMMLACWELHVRHTCRAN